MQTGSSHLPVSVRRATRSPAPGDRCGASFTRRDLRRRASRRAPCRDAGCPPLDPGGTPRRAIALPGASCLDLGIAEAMNPSRHVRAPADGRGPGIDRKALWVVTELGLPTIVKACVSCRSTRHHPTGKIRVNANHKLLDVWLLIGCALCGRTSKIPVHERINVRAMENERLLMFENNDPAMVRQLTMDATLARRAAYQLDWTGTWQLDTDIPFYDLQREDAAPLEVIIRF